MLDWTQSGMLQRSCMTNAGVNRPGATRIGNLIDGKYCVIGTPSARQFAVTSMESEASAQLASYKRLGASRNTKRCRTWFGSVPDATPQERPEAVSAPLDWPITDGLRDARGITSRTREPVSGQCYARGTLNRMCDRWFGSYHSCCWRVRFHASVSGTERRACPVGIALRATAAGSSITRVDLTGNAPWCGWRRNYGAVYYHTRTTAPGALCSTSILQACAQRPRPSTQCATHPRLPRAAHRYRETQVTTQYSGIRANPWN